MSIPLGNDVDEYMNIAGYDDDDDAPNPTIVEPNDLQYSECDPDEDVENLRKRNTASQRSKKRSKKLNARKDHEDIILNKRIPAPFTSNNILTMQNPIANYRVPQKRSHTVVDPLDWYIHYENPIEKEERSKKKARAMTEANLINFSNQIQERQQILQLKNNDLVGEDDATYELAYERHSNLLCELPLDSFVDFVTISNLEGTNQLYITHAPERFHGIEEISYDFSIKSKRLLPNFESVYRAAEDLLVEHAKAISLRDDKHEDSIIDSAEIDNVQLWVEKYRPNGYNELVSDESTNRSLLTWFKLWDECVFKRKIQQQQPKPTPPPSHQNPKFRSFFQSRELSTKLDKMKRPADYKLVLLCGPPGLGKTTLAHIVARQAGYNVLEMNASDDRKKEQFEERVDGATTHVRSLNAAGGMAKPNCLIIDEIDGAPSASIDYIVKLAKDAAPLKKKERRILKRPIVCICNDLWAPALRELRKVSLTLHVPSNDSSRLASRVTSICNIERINMECRAIEALCAKTHNDIRSCINFLQFVARKTTLDSKENAVSIDEVRQLTIGQKDSNESLINLYKLIFIVPKQAQNNALLRARILPTGESVIDTSKGYNVVERLRRIGDAVRSFGDDDGVMQLVHETSLKLIPHAKLSNTIALTSWFELASLLEKVKVKYQAFELLKYAMAQIPRIAHLNCSTTNKQNVSFEMPKQRFLYLQKQNRNTSILFALLNNSSTVPVRYFEAPESLLLTSLPLVLRVIAPVVKTTSVHLFGVREKAAIQMAVETLLHYNICYTQQRIQNQEQTGTYLDYLLEPDIGLIVDYPQKESSESDRNKSLYYSIKQMISSECEKALIRHSQRPREENLELKSNENQNETSMAQITQSAMVNDVQMKDTSAKINTISNKNSMADFFARKQSQMRNAQSVKSAGQTSIWYKYSVGYTNAVRRNIRMNYFL